MAKKIKTGTKLAVSYLMYYASFLIPKDKTVWIFIGWHRSLEREIFADNSKTLFLYCAENCPTITTVWIARDEKLAAILRHKGLRAYSRSSALGAWYSLRANYTFIDAFMELENWRFTGRSKIVQLWHGKGMKKTGHDSPYSLTRYGKLSFPNLYTRYYKLIASSPYTARLMGSTFKTNPTQVLVSGLPRTDIFFENILHSDIDMHNEAQNLIARLRSEGGRSIFLYAPTFRPSGDNPLDTIDLPKLNAALKASHQHMVAMVHQKSALKGSREMGFSNIHRIRSEFDLYPILPAFDGLITDYSSLYVDYLLLDKPMIFYTFDLDTYTATMGLHEDFATHTPGPKVKTAVELVAAITDAVERDPYQHERQKIRDLYHTHQNGHASARIMESLQSLR